MMWNDKELHPVVGNLHRPVKTKTKKRPMCNGPFDHPSRYAPHDGHFYCRHGMGSPHELALKEQK